jgi:hypothetical protein
MEYSSAKNDMIAAIPIAMRKAPLKERRERVWVSQFAAL